MGSNINCYNRYFLDCNAISYLFGHPIVSDATIQEVRERLLQMKASFSDCVIGSVNLLEELAGASSDPDRFIKLKDFVPQLFGNQILLPWQDRVRIEIQTGNPVPEEEMFLETSDVSLALEQWAKKQDIPSLVRNMKINHKSGTETARAGVFRQIQPGKSTRQPVKESKKQADEWFSNFEEQKQSWFQDQWQRLRRDLGLSDDISLCPNVETLPANHAWITSNLTRIYELQGLGLRSDEGDLYDLAHFIDAINADFLVTDDRKFRQTCDLAPWRPFKHITFEIFCEKIQAE